MKISILSAWNSDSGSGIHAELIAREWIKMGHRISVFSFIKSDFHGKDFLREDESYVMRCFGTSKTNFFDPISIVANPMDILVVEDLGMLPKDGLAKIFPILKSKAKTVNIIHDRKLSSDPSFYQFDWDRIIVFNKRYKNIFDTVYEKEKIEIIPYPCGFWKEGNKEKNREVLKLPYHKKIIFLFGQWAMPFLPYFSAITEISREYPIYLLIVSREKDTKKEYFKMKGEKIEVDFREKIISNEEMYDYLHASDVFIFGDKKVEGAVVCSTALFSLGTGVPMISPRSNFFETFDKEVLKYSDSEELKQNIIEIFKKGNNYKKMVLAQRRFVEENNPRKIAEKYISLFQKLLTA